MIITFSFRPINQSDRIEKINQILREAYSSLAANGMKYAASHEDIEATRKNLDKFECHLVISNSEIIGCVTIRRPGVEHVFTSSDNSEGERLYFFINTKMWNKLGGIVSEPKILPVSQLSKELLFHLLIHPKTKAAQSLCETLVQTFSEMLEQVIPSGLDSFSGKISDPRVKKVWVKIQESYQEQISMDQLAQASGLSIRSLNRLFLDESGMTPKQAITFHRVKKPRSFFFKINRSRTLLMKLDIRRFHSSLRPSEA